MYDAIDISCFIINYCNSNKNYITNLKLQKLLYFVQAAYIASFGKDKGCYIDNIEAWDLGPVVPNVYHYFKRFGGSYITDVNCYYKQNENLWDNEIVEYNDNCIKESDKKI